ncbi:NAD(P)/FAD-dependent oxidoreductase [Roseburia sp. AM16-25]|uniref:NAD(P)/FAD-dependent oxidoreductase n=1 Tax=Roseburia sp. AM16-25 TaxID=2292065 RepID=UPI000E5019C1|nr:NAD(P)/FAD-dependent oxidoreductase [Roseburia sp. AM16-25]RHO32116.1 NAD(P)/FAD-dependent oxidoreductase [Roseburia sp. AM16-25]
MSKVLVIGGGAAGMMAAYAAGMCGHEVTLLEQNEKLGKKIYITGKGRCNFTNASPLEEIMQAVVSNPKFLYSAFYTFSNDAVMDFFENQGMPYKIERGNRAFPVSDHASDVIRALERAMKEQDVRIRLHTQVRELLIEDDKATGVLLTDGDKIMADSLILATGGLSYPTTGSTGDGHTMAKNSGHKIVTPRPALVPLTTKEEYILRMQGLSLKNVSLKIKDEKRVIYDSFGEMLFTHFGVSGPLVLSASSVLSRHFPREYQAYIDLKPALSEEVLNERLLREFSERPNQHIKAVFQQLLPAKMIPVMIELSQISMDKPVNAITKEERRRLVGLFKAFPFTITGTRGFKEAIITQGGVSVKDIDPATMESKRIKDLYLVGELLDLDALTGGYNLQIAWSTGYLAGISIK